MKFNLSPREKAAIASLRRAGVSTTAVADAFCITKGVVSATLSADTRGSKMSSAKTAPAPVAVVRSYAKRSTRTTSAPAL